MKKLWYRNTSSVHGKGLFASQNIKKGTTIIEYVGDKVSKKEGDKRAGQQLDKSKKNKKNGMVYIFELNQRYDIDGDVLYNNARHINHSCNPNCEVEIYNNRLWISSTKNIKKNTELSYNYGYLYDTDYVDHICKCGASKCVGYILDEDHWPRLRKKR